MNTTMTDDEFRARVRAWLRENLPEEMVRRSRTGVHPSKADMLGVTAVLHRAGWSVPHWPVAYGGPGWSPMRAFILEEELTLAGGPANNIQGVSLAGPVIFTFGTEAQKARFLPPIREGREFWSQGFSEPNSGSDLASLRTRAVREGDDYIVDGQKIWTSQAMFADWLFCLVRTDPTAKPQMGISFLLIDMRSPGITVRPIPSIDEGESLCEVFFDAVRVPVANRVGEAGKGWDYAKFLLGRERVQTAELPRNKLYLSRLLETAAVPARSGVAPIHDPVFRSRIAHLATDLIGLEAAVVGAIESNDPSPVTPSALKVVGTELMQAQLALQVEALGPAGAAMHRHSDHVPEGAATGPAHAVGVTAEFLFRRATTIYGGSNEIQKNIIAKQLFAGDLGSAPALTEDQSMLRASAERFAQRAYPLSAPHTGRWLSGESGRAAWRALVEAGFTALAQPEAWGGFGAGAELSAVCEAFGEGLVPLPVVGVIASAGQLLAGLPAESPRREALGRALIDGGTILALADDEPGTPAGSRGVSARSQADGWVVDGVVTLVPGGAIAERFVLVADGPGHRTVLLDVPADAPGLTVQPYRTVDGQGVADLRMVGLRLPSEARLADGPAADAALARARDWALVMASADAVGTMSQALRITLDYLQARQQFGAALASFQALRHRLAEMFAELVVARALVRRAVAALAQGPGERARLAAACKARVGRAAMMVGNQSVQLHGGIGMTEAYVIGRYYKRLFAFDRLLGGPAFHQGRVAQGLF